MRDIKIAFFDVDGTLKALNKEISENTIKALNRLQEKGIIICLATGRTPMTIPHFNCINFDAFLTFNGSYCYTNDNKLIFSNSLGKDDLHKLVDNAKVLGKPVTLATPNKIISNGTNSVLEEYHKFAKISVIIDPKFDEVLENEEVYQLMTTVNPSEFNSLLEGTDNVKTAYWWDAACDVIPATGGKGNGIRAMLEYYGLTKENAIAFGDGNNDIEMLEAVGLGVAVNNATEGLKAVADEICGSVDDDGVYHYLVENNII